MATASQIAANQANSRLSTGPTSELGKQTASRNALKHGLAGKGLILPDEEQAAAQKRAAELTSSLRPGDAFEVALVEQIAFEEIRAASCRAHQNARRTIQAQRAGTFWHLDRRLAAEFLARGLAHKPAIVSRQLQQTKQGNDLLIEFWQALAGALVKQSDWDETQRARALDLMGVAPELRSGGTRLDTPEGYTGPEWRAETVAYHLDILQAQQPALEELDGHEQAMAMYGLEPTPDSELKRLQRYEAAALRRMQWAYKQLQDRQSGRSPRPARTDRPASSEPTRDEVRARAKKQDEDLDALRYETWRMMDEAGVHRELCSEGLLREAALTTVRAEPKAAVGVPARPADSSRPPQPPQGNRRARRAAKLKARQARRS